MRSVCFPTGVKGGILTSEVLILVPTNKVRFPPGPPTAAQPYENHISKQTDHSIVLTELFVLFQGF